MNIEDTITRIYEVAGKNYPVFASHLKDDDADGGSFQHGIVALEGSGVLVARPVGIEDNFPDVAIVSPAGGNSPSSRVSRVR